MKRETNCGYLTPLLHSRVKPCCADSCFHYQLVVCLQSGIKACPTLSKRAAVMSPDQGQPMKTFLFPLKQDNTSTQTKCILSVRPKITLPLPSTIATSQIKNSFFFLQHLSSGNFWGDIATFFCSLVPFKSECNAGRGLRSRWLVRHWRSTMPLAIGWTYSV